MPPGARPAFKLDSYPILGLHTARWSLSSLTASERGATIAAEHSIAGMVLGAPWRPSHAVSTLPARQPRPSEILLAVWWPLRAYVRGVWDRTAGRCTVLPPMRARCECATCRAASPHCARGIHSEAPRREDPNFAWRA